MILQPALEIPINNERHMAGMTHPEWRLSLINKIKSCYTEYRNACERLDVATESANKDRISLWTDRKKKAGVALEEKLPEVKFGPVDMDAIAFAKSLLRA